MAPPTTLDRHLEDPAFRREYAEESFVIDVLEKICEWMDSHDVSRADLAKRLGTSKANVTQMLRGRNVSLRTLAGVVHVLDGVPQLTIQPAQPVASKPCERVEPVGPVEGAKTPDARPKRKRSTRRAERS